MAVALMGAWLSLDGAAWAGPAEPAPPTGTPPTAEEVRADAARFNSRGIELYKSQQYGAAVEQLASAYRLDPDPSILCNLARAQYKLQPGAAAAEHLERCLQLDTTLSATSRQTLEGYLKESRERVAGEGPEPAPAPLSGGGVVVAKRSSRPLWRLALGGGLTAAGLGLVIGGAYALSLNDQCVDPASDCMLIYKTTAGGATALSLGSLAMVGGVILMAWPAPKGNRP